MNIKRRLTPVPQPVERWHELKARQLRERIELMSHAVVTGGTIPAAAALIGTHSHTVGSFIYDNGLTVKKILENAE